MSSLAEATGEAGTSWRTGCLPNKQDVKIVGQALLETTIRLVQIMPDQATAKAIERDTKRLKIQLTESKRRGQCTYHPRISRSFHLCDLPQGYDRFHLHYRYRVSTAPES